MPGPGCEMMWGLSLESVGTLAGIGKKEMKKAQEELKILEGK